MLQSMETTHLGLFGLLARRVATEGLRLVAEVARTHRHFTKAKIVRILVLKKKFKNAYSRPVQLTVLGAVGPRGASVLLRVLQGRELV